MRAVVQRVTTAAVTQQATGEVSGRINRGLVVLLGVAEGDTAADALYLADKIVGLRIFEDENDKMNLSLTDVGGQMLAVSQFTLLADCRRGRRPSFTEAAKPAEAEALYQVFVDEAKKSVPVQTGVFRTDMLVEIYNDGPVTIILDTRN